MFMVPCDWVLDTAVNGILWEKKRHKNKALSYRGTGMYPPSTACL